MRGILYEAGLLASKLSERHENVDSGETNERVHDAADHRHVAEDCADEVEIQDSNQSPVEAADHDEHESQLVHSFEAVHRIVRLNDNAIILPCAVHAILGLQSISVDMLHSIEYENHLHSIRERHHWR